MRRMLGMMVGLLISTALVAPPRVQAQTTDPVAVVKAYSAAVNAGDFDALFALYADDAVIRSTAGLFVGKQAIGQFLQGPGEAVGETINDIQVNGTTVIATVTVSLTRLLQLGIGPIESRTERIIENGKIRFFNPAPLLTPEQQDKLRAAPQPPAPAVDPVTVVKNYISSANTGDFAKTFAFYADNAVVKNPVGLFVGKQAIGAWLQQDVQTTRATPENFQVINGGTTVIVTGMVSLARFTAIGIDQVAFRSDYLVEGDKIKYFSPTTLLTPEQQEKVRAAGPPPGAPVPVAMPATGGSNAIDNRHLMILGAVVFIIGLGLLMRRRPSHP